MNELIRALEGFPGDAEVRLVTVSEDHGIGRVVRHPGQAVSIESDEDAEDEMEYWRRAGLDHRGRP